MRQRSSAEEIVALLRRSRFAVLGAFVLAGVALHASHGHWIGDFWEHSAVVRELATHPLHPRHPLLLVDAPHAFTNPYAWLVALFCRLSGTDSVTGLMAAGVVNLVMLFMAVPLFVRRFSPESTDAVSFYLLLFMLLLWGRDPWQFSGFYHVNVLSHALAYPSACAFWVSLLLLALNAKRAAGGSWRLVLATTAMSAFVLLVHPVAFLFVATGLVATALDAHEPRREILVAVGGLATAVAIALAWPLFPLWTLLTQASAFNGNNAAMYSHPLLRTYPVLIGVPLVVSEARRTRRWGVAVWLAMLLVLYAFGFASAAYNYGRVVFFLAFLLQFEIARFVVRLEGASESDEPNRRWPLATAITAIACLLLSAPAIMSTARDTIWGERTAAGFEFLAADVGQYDVMMADVNTGWVAASFGGKLVSAQHPLAFVSEEDQRARRAAVKSFFDSGSSQAQRQELLSRYRVAYLLARRADGDTSVPLAREIRALGTVTHEDGHFLLVRVNPRQDHAAPAIAAPSR